MKLFQLSQTDFYKRLESALLLDLNYVDRMVRPEMRPQSVQPTPAAVLILFGFSENEPSVLLIRRTETVETHKGQMAFPGGHCESSDCDGPVSTALRETEEEVGIPHDKVHILGKLPSLITITGYLIQPVVGNIQCSINDVVLNLDQSEIAEAIWIPLRILMNDTTYREETIAVGSARYPIHVYQVQQYRIWGATGSMLKNLLDRLVSLG